MPFQKGNKLGLLRRRTSGWKLSEEQRKKISERMKGKMPKNLSLINANKMGSGNPMWGKHMTDNSKTKLSQSLKESYLIRRNHQNNWDQDNKTISYQNFHRKVRKLFGTPNTCESCKKIEISNYRIHWASKNHTYSEKREDWIRLCAKCHKAYDFKNVKTA